MQKVKVRPGPRLGPDGKRPRIGRPDRDGRERPGNYLFHDVKNPGLDVHPETGRAIGEPAVFVFVDREEDVFDTPMIREAIRQGFLFVVDTDSELAVFNVTPPEPPPEPDEDTEEADPPKKKAARKSRKRTASED